MSRFYFSLVFFLTIFVATALLNGCDDNDGPNTRIRINVPGPKKNALLERLFFSEGPEAMPVPCSLPTFRVRVAGGGIYPPIVSDNISADLDYYSAPYITVNETIEVMVPKGNARHIDIKGLAYDSNCTFSATGYQTIILYGSIGPLDITESATLTIPVVIDSNSSGTQATYAAAATFSYNTFGYITDLGAADTISHACPSAAAYYVEIQDEDLDIPIKYYGTNSQPNPGFHIGPVFPDSNYSYYSYCTSSPLVMQSDFVHVPAVPSAAAPFGREGFVGP